MTMMAWRSLLTCLDRGLGAHHEASASGAVGFEDSRAAVDHAAVGKSGPCTNFRSSASCALGLFTSVIVASTISVRLCGGILVAMPTAIPSDPLIKRFGTRAGRTSGSFRCRRSWE